MILLVDQKVDQKVGLVLCLEKGGQKPHPTNHLTTLFYADFGCTFLSRVTSSG